MPTDIRHDAAKAAPPLETKRMPVDTNIHRIGDSLVSLLISLNEQREAGLYDEDRGP